MCVTSWSQKPRTRHKCGSVVRLRVGIGRCEWISLLHTGHAAILFSSDYEIVSMKGQHDPYVCIRAYQMKSGHSWGRDYRQIIYPIPYELVTIRQW